MGARATKFRLTKLKESENDAVVRVYSDYFLDPFDDESPQDKTTREEEKREEAELDEVIWSNCSVGGGLYERLAVGNIYVFPMETCTFDEIPTLGAEMDDRLVSCLQKKQKMKPKKREKTKKTRKKGKQ